MMSKDIHKWSDGRYTLMFDEHTFFVWDNEKDKRMTALNVTKKLNELSEENERLKKELKRCKDWINSDKYDYELTLAFIKNKGYSLKDVLEYEKELENG